MKQEASVATPVRAAPVQMGTSMISPQLARHLKKSAARPADPKARAEPAPSDR